MHRLFVAHYKSGIIFYYIRHIISIRLSYLIPHLLKKFSKSYINIK